jgi:hypothetical protein
VAPLVDQFGSGSLEVHDHLRWGLLNALIGYNIFIPKRLSREGCVPSRLVGSSSPCHRRNRSSPRERLDSRTRRHRRSQGGTGRKSGLTGGVEPLPAGGQVGERTPDGATLTQRGVRVAEKRTLDKQVEHGIVSVGFVVWPRASRRSHRVQYICMYPYGPGGGPCWLSSPPVFYATALALLCVAIALPSAL